MDSLAVPDTEAHQIAQFRLEAKDWDALGGLTGKQQAFVWEYLKDMNATRAADRAGYAGGEGKLAVRGHLLMRHPIVNPLIRKLTAATADEMGITREYVLSRIREVEQRIMAGAPKVHVTKDGDMFEVKDDAGNTIQEWSPQAATQALATLAKLRGDMIDRVDVTTRSIEIKINGTDLKDLT